MDSILKMVVDTLALFASVVALVVALKKAPHENSNLDAGTAESSAQAVALYSKEIVNLKKRIGELEKEMTSVCNELQQVKHENYILREHNVRLSAQVVSLGGTPVPAKTS